MRRAGRPANCLPAWCTRCRWTGGVLRADTWGGAKAEEPLDKAASRRERGSGRWLGTRWRSGLEARPRATVAHTSRRRTVTLEESGQRLRSRSLWPRRDGERTAGAWTKFLMGRGVLKNLGQILGYSWDYLDYPLGPLLEHVSGSKCDEDTGPVRLSEFWRNLDGLEEYWRNL